MKKIAVNYGVIVEEMWNYPAASGSRGVFFLAVIKGS
jgi:hypothetical protein